MARAAAAASNASPTTPSSNVALRRIMRHLRRNPRDPLPGNLRANRSPRPSFRRGGRGEGRQRSWGWVAAVVGRGAGGRGEVAAVGKGGGRRGVGRRWW